ncbi:hypothetical protein SAMN04488571_103258 [Methanoculleus thermophilus]|jgi:ornithine cyclodeaminase/alanine dehydrogenase-like protein (mu-crystallin family)|uniref:Uncharacterized protein n=1 Tax=Methanoculleus thermophilus TaxID=2200 RepID=A0A1G8YZP7_9EURY|nr:hypothetical protein SAMN04488571_103258 [Methanoculleus thermophilus]
MAGDKQYLKDQIEVVVNCVLVDYRGDSESRDRVIHAIIEWAEEHPDEWDELQARCQQRHEILA